MNRSIALVAVLAAPAAPCPPETPLTVAELCQLADAECRRCSKPSTAEFFGGESPGPDAALRCDQACAGRARSECAPYLDPKLNGSRR